MALAMGKWGCWLAVAVYIVVRGKEAMYSNLVNKVKTAIAEVKAAIAASPLAKNFKYAAEPCIICNSDASTTAKVYINIWDSQAGTRTRGIIDKSLLFGTHSCYVRTASANAGAPLCQRCWH